MATDTRPPPTDISRGGFSRKIATARGKAEPTPFAPKAGDSALRCARCSLAFDHPSTCVRPKDHPLSPASFSPCSLLWMSLLQIPTQAALTGLRSEWLSTVLVVPAPPIWWKPTTRRTALWTMRVGVGTRRGATGRL